MKKIIAAASATVAGAVVSVASFVAPNNTPHDPSAKNIYAFKMEDIHGKEVSLERFKGKVLLVVNVASKCGFTPQYEGLEALYKKYAGQGLVVLGFPANNFGQQEPGTDQEIEKFCKSKYSVTFPMFSKISVKGDDTAPLYKWLLTQTDQHQDIEWNFTKFVVGRDGQVIKRFRSQVTPQDKDLVATIESALKTN